MEVRKRIRDAMQRAADQAAFKDAYDRRILNTRCRDAAILTLALALGALTAVTAYPGPGGADQAHTAQIERLKIGLDPNTAAWGELALLPGLGESVSRRIVEYRDRMRAELENPNAVVFSRVTDLQQIKGIGERTLRRIGVFLRFPPYRSPP